MKYKINKYVIDAESPIKAAKIAKMLDSKTNDEEYSFKELMNMLVAKHPNKNGHQTDIFKVNGKYSLNPNVHKERFNSLEEIKKHIEMSGNDSCNDSFDFTKRLSGWEKLPFDVRDKLLIKCSKEEINQINVNELGNYLENAHIVKEGYGKHFAEDIISDLIKRMSDSCNDEESMEEKIHKAQEWVDFDIKHHGEVSELTKRDIEKMGLKYDKWNNQVTDSDIEELSKEEEQAIADYKAAISNTKDPKLLKIFGHILKEEVEHLEELQNKELEDSIKN